jgi:hypothetical protein
MDYKKAVEDKKAELSSLHLRMDEDRKLVELAKYALKDVNEKNVPNSVSVTLNDPAVFAANVEASLGAATEQVVAESENKNLDTAYIEDFARAAFGSANSRLSKQGRFPLNPFTDQQMCRRGRGAARCFFRMDKKTGQLITDIVPWDSRYVYYDMGMDGVIWASYETTRSKAKIEAAYPKARVDDESAIVLDIWDSEHNEVWVGEEQVFEQKNPYGYPPVVVQVVPMGSMLADPDSQAYQGESIFFLIRDLVPELNRMVSIIQSLNMKALDNALLWRSQDGTQATPPTHKDLTTPGSVTATDIQGGAEPVNYGELKQHAYLLHQMIETRIQRGSLSSIDLGTLQFELSAVALIELGEGRDQVFLPRLGARGLLNQQLADMIIDQVTQIGATSVELGTRGHKRSFDVSKLQGEYEVSFKYFVKSPKVDVARFSMAAAAGNLIPDMAKRRDILQREDPEEDERQLRWEEAERLSPAIKINRTIRTLLEMAKRGDKHAEFEAELLSAEMGINLKQMLSGNSQQAVKPEEAQKPQTLVPLFSKGGGTSSAKKSSQRQTQPRQSEEGE